MLKEFLSAREKFYTDTKGRFERLEELSKEAKAIDESIDEEIEKYVDAVYEIVKKTKGNKKDYMDLMAVIQAEVSEEEFATITSALALRQVKKLCKNVTIIKI